MEFGFRVVYAQDVLAESGYAKVAHLPCILDSRPGYHRLGSRFLIDRGLGIWDPNRRGSDQSPLPPSANSMKNYADRLANFLEWCEIRGMDPLQAEYKRDLIGRYQGEMLKGIWSRDGTALAARTINSRVDVAADYLSWAADKGLRPPFDISKVRKTYLASSPTSGLGHLPRAVEVRKGKVRENKRRLGFPLETDIFDWLHRVYERKGEVGQLICEMILETAVRREEAACWRVDTLPRDPAEWKIANRYASLEQQAVLVDIRYGAKGKEYGRDHGDKIGPVGTIRIPMHIALKLHEYREKIRPKTLAIAISQGKTITEQRKIRDETVHLFLNPQDGQRYTGADIYELWRSVKRPKGWSPHLARDFWACSLLWQRIEQQQQLLELARQANNDIIALHAFQNNALSIIRLEIQPQLRHVSTETTMIYLQWLSDRLGVNLNLHQRWLEQLDEDGETEE